MDRIYFTANFYFTNELVLSCVFINSKSWWALLSPNMFLYIYISCGTILSPNMFLYIYLVELYSHLTISCFCMLYIYLVELYSYLTFSCFCTYILWNYTLTWHSHVSVYTYVRMKYWFQMWIAIKVLSRLFICTQKCLP